MDEPRPDRQAAPLRPYPVQLVKKILADVESRGTEADRKQAVRYLSKINGGPNFHGIAGALGRTNTVNGYAQMTLEASLQGSVLPWIRYSAKIGAVGISALSASYLMPDYQRTELDFVTDNPGKTVGLYPRMSMVGGGALGTDAVYVQAGALRGSYARFWGDNAVLSPTSPQSGQFSLSITTTLCLLPWRSWTSRPRNQTVAACLRTSFFPSGGLEFYPFDWLTLGVFDAVCGDTGLIRPISCQLFPST